MDHIENLRKEREQITKDVYDNKIPKRVPVNVSLGLFAAAEYAGVDPREAYWNPGLLEEAGERLCEMIPSDSSVLGGAILTPTKYQALGSKSIVMSETGFMQHPNTHMMEPEDYDAFIEDPYATIVETCVPRVYKNLDYKKDPVRAMFTISQANECHGKAMAISAQVSKRLADKFGYPNMSFRMGGGGGYAPMDILSDQLRSFTGMSVDIRRNRSKVQAALDAVYPLNYKKCLPPDMSKYTRYAAGFYPLHMATFMREKDFAELWWPSFHRQATDFASLGIRIGAFLEDDWTRFLDYVQDLPTGTYLTFEYGDPKAFKEKLGKKHILGGGFPIKYLTTLTKAEIIDKTKEWLDIMAPGGQYSFGFDKSPLVFNDVNLENLKAVVETVLEYGVYDNPGTPTGEIFNKEDYTHSEYVPFKSRIYKTWEQYKEEHPFTPENAKPIVMGAEDSIFNFYYSLCQ
ncbi:MAG: uroporphyrinogen decarboxylase [Firmicutes bacterium]|nr:uroporphyrinogen decarboxylase [Bacillota bacterium]